MARYSSRDVMNWVSTVVVLLAAINAGMNLGIFNPTLPDIALLTGSTTTETSSTLGFVGLFSMAGAVAFGTLFDRFNGLSVLALALLLQGISLGLSPWCPDLLGYQVFSSAMALFNYGILAGVFATNCKIWRSRPEVIAPVIQLTDMLHVLGVAITPQVVKPFVGRIPVPQPPDSHSNNASLPLSEMTSTVSAAVSYNSSWLQANTTAATTTPPLVLPIQLAYLIIAGLDILMAAICLVVYVADVIVTKRRRRSETRRASRRRSYSLNEEQLRKVASHEALAALNRTRRANSVDNIFGGLRSELITLCPEAMIVRTEEQGIPPISCKFSIVALVSIVFVFFISLGSRETMLTGLLFTYLSETLSWTTAAGTMLISGYHLTRVLVHVLIVLIARWVSPLKLTLGNLLIQLVSAGLMLVVSAPCVIAGVLLSGVATSNICPTAITLARTSFQLTGRAMGIFIGAVACGQVIISPVVGRLLERPRADVAFPAVLLILSLAAALLFIPWVAIAHVVRRETETVRVLEWEEDDVKLSPGSRRPSIKPYNRRMSLRPDDNRRPSLKPDAAGYGSRRLSLRPDDSRRVSIRAEDIRSGSSFSRQSVIKPDGTLVFEPRRVSIKPEDDDANEKTPLID